MTASMINPKNNSRIGRRKAVEYRYRKSTVLRQKVTIGANSCAIGDMTIGNNVTIGAMSLINKNVPDNHTVYNSKDMIVIQKAA